MDEKVKDHLLDYCKKKGWEINEDNLDAELLEVLRGANKQVHREEVSQHRWWNEFQYVVEINGMLIGYVYAEANRDESVEDLGYEFDLSTICRMRAVPKTVTTYVVVTE